VFANTRADAKARLEAFLPEAGKAYASKRNFHGDTTSRLSPAIRRKLITEAEVVSRALSAQGYARAEKFIQEVCWRTYWVGWLQQRPEIWTRYRADLTRLEPNDAVKAAMAGQTGIDCFDAWAQELTATGWLHNHVRMNFASIWIFTLRLPWQLGADFFYQHLLDACPAANTLSWRWVAGLQTQGKTYLASAERIRQMSGSRFTISAPLAREAIALPLDLIPAPRALPPAETPDPNQRTGLFITTADLSVETQPLPNLAALAATTHIGGHPAPLKRAYAETALTDALTRASTLTGLPPERLNEATPIDAMLTWAAQHNLTQIITGEAPTGPEADRLDALTPALAAEGIRLIRRRRRWDDLAWPLANKGFFAFKAGIPKLIAG